MKIVKEWLTPWQTKVGVQTLTFSIIITSFTRSWSNWLCKRLLPNQHSILLWQPWWSILLAQLFTGSNMKLQWINSLGWKEWGSSNTCKQRLQICTCDHAWWTRTSMSCCVWMQEMEWSQTFIYSKGRWWDVITLFGVKAKQQWPCNQRCG